MSFDLDDLYDQTVGRMCAPSAQTVHVATEPEDIVINPADIYSSGLSSDDQLTPTDSTLNTPTITLADTFEDTTMSSKEDKLAGYAAAYAAQQDPVSPFLFPNAGLGLSSLGLKKSVKGLGSMPTANLGASFGATSSFMTNVGELFDDYGLRSSKLFSGYNPASPSAGTGGGAIDAKLLDFLNAPCLSAGEIQDNRKAAAAQALGLPSPFLPSVPTPPPASKPDYTSQFSPTVTTEQRDWQEPQWTEPPRPATPRKVLRTIKSVGDFRSPKIDLSSAPPVPAMTNFLQTPGADPNPARNRNRDAGPLDAPAPQSAVPPVKMVRTSSKPRNKNHFDKSLTAHLGRSPKSPAMPPAPQVWQHPTASPRFDGLMPTPDLSAPTNSPASVFNGATATSGLQFSFSDLYNLGLVEGGTLDCQPSTSLPEPATTKAEPTAWLEPGDYRTTNPLGNFLSPPAAGSPVFSSPASTWSSSPDLFLDPAGGDHFSQIPMQMTSSGSSSSSNYVPASVGTNQAPQLVEYFDHMLQGNLSTPKRPERMIAEPPPFVPSSPTKHTDGAAPTYDFLNHDPAPALNRSPRKLNKKRSRQDFEDPDSISTDFHTDCDTHGSPSASDGESDFDAVDVAWSVPPSPTKGGHGQQQTYTSRRLRPGPKPKRAISQPEPYYQTLSGPPPAEILAQALSTMPGEDQYHNTTDDEGLIGSLPKSVVRNLYEVQKAPEGEQGRRFNCLVPGCDRVFPRKSAVESHIQTHLEDKPFVCPSPECGAAFVRAHDLKRHARIHSGRKPFECPCGKGFARGDALARHRQRGICDGSLVPRRA